MIEGDRIKKDSAFYKKELQRLTYKKKIANIKYLIRKMKFNIFRQYLPHFHFQFNKFIVIFSITVIIAYTIVSILLQKYMMMEISPTLTTCIFAFFGTELIGLAGIKCFDTKYSSTDIDYINVNADADNNKTSDMNDDNAVG